MKTKLRIKIQLKLRIKINVETVQTVLHNIINVKYFKSLCMGIK